MILVDGNNKNKRKRNNNKTTLNREVDPIQNNAGLFSTVCAGLPLGLFQRGHEQ